MILRATFRLLSNEEDIEYDNDVFANLSEDDKCAAVREAALDNLEWDWEEIEE